MLGGIGSTATLWSLADERIDATHLPRIRGAPMPANRHGQPVLIPTRDCWLHPDVDAAIMAGIRRSIPAAPPASTPGVGEAAIRMDLSKRPTGTRLTL